MSRAMLLLTLVVMVWAAVMVWQSHRQIMAQGKQSLAISKKHNELVISGVSEQYPAYHLLYKIANSARLFKYEMLLVTLDSDRNDDVFKALYKEISILYTALKHLSSQYLPNNVSHNELLENVGILLDIAEEVFDTPSSNERRQLLQDTIEPIVSIQKSLSNLETVLIKNTAEMTAHLQQQMSAEEDSIEKIHALFNSLDFRLLLILSTALVLILFLQWLISHVLQDRLKQLREYANLIAQERFDAEPVIEVADDTGKLANSMWIMAERLQSAQKRLIQTAQEAEKAKISAEIANKSKSTFLANMSHELRTPLNGILGYTQILKRDKTLSDHQQSGISVIHRSGEHLLTLINDILDLSKIEADRIELYPTDFHLDDFLKDIVDIFQMRVKQKEISFIYEKLSHLPTAVHADEKRLRQVIINLLSNAVKFTMEGGISFKVGYHNKKIRFQVDDTGAGISADDIKYIFQPFRQVGDKEARAEGTGLGLSITKRLVEMMGGELQVESTLGKGSTFWMELDLPVAKGFMKEDKNKEPIILGFEGQSKKILVVDDKEANRAVLVNLLRPLGFEIIEAINGRECIDKTMYYEPDMILTDLVMPVMDGFEATRQIRQIPEIKDVIIIMISASVFECYQEQSLDAGCNGFLPKPIKVEDLLEQLEKHLNLRWIYEQSQIEEKPEQEIESAQNTNALILPNSEQMAILSNLAKIGDLESIVKTLHKFEQTNAEISLFANQIYKLAEQFEARKAYDLIWHYTQKQHGKKSDEQGLSKAQVSVLLDLAMMGDLDGIVEKLDEFEEENKNIMPFANKIRKLAENFEEEQICNLIEEYS